MEETANLNKPTKKDECLIRVDKNLSKNSIRWLMDFGQDAMLCFDILVYISKDSQKNIFNFGTIDLDKFAKEMGYTKANLQRIREASKKINIQERLEGNTPVTVFEHALFKLAKSNLQFTTTVYDSSRHEKIEQNKFIQIIKDINIHIPNGKSKTKIYYSYTTTDEFDYNLARYFFFIDPTQIKQLRDKGVLLLYFYIKNLENSKYSEFIETDFKKILHLSGISLENKEKIRFAKQNLKNRKLEYLKTIIHFDYEFINVSGKFDFGIKWKFPHNLLANTNPEAKALVEIKDANTITKANNDFIDLKLVKHYQETFNDFNEANYKAWYNDKNRDFQVKMDIFFSCIAILHNIPKSKARKDFFDHSLAFFNIKEKNT
jgi:hypothetical protein